MTVLQGYWNKWLNKRIPAATQHHLNHQNIFIFPAKFGLLFLSLCVLLFLLGTNYQNNLMLLLCYFLLAIFLVNLLASYINFARIDLQIGKCSEVFVGDNLHGGREDLKICWWQRKGGGGSIWGYVGAGLRGERGRRV